MTQQLVTPWEVEGKIDYKKLVEQFGTEFIDENLQEKFKSITGKDLHPWLKRGIFFSHRALNKLLDAYANKEPVFLYTGRGPTSDSMHIGHLIPFIFTKWLQDVLDCVLVIQIADDEKYYFKNLDFKTIYNLGFENAKDIIAIGFNPAKTFIFSNRDYRMRVNQYEVFVSDMKKNITAKTVSKIFGFGDNATVGMYDWPFYQSAAAFSQAFPHIFGDRQAHCLVAYAIDQDPYFRMARDLATTMNLIKPYSIMCTFIPPLCGVMSKMSSSVGTESTIFLTDSEEVVRQKIGRAFSGGRSTLEDHKKYGGNSDIDVSYQYLRYFEKDDNKLFELKQGFENGSLTCGDLKAHLTKILVEIIQKHAIKRSKVTEDDIKEFYSMKKIELPTQIEHASKPEEEQIYKIFKDLDINHITLYHKPINSAFDEEEVERILCGNGIAMCKNVILKGKENSFYLYVADTRSTKKINLIQKKLKVPKLRFAEREWVSNLMNTKCPTIFGLVNDTKKKINLIIDEDLKNYKSLCFHPMRNDATTKISFENVLKFVSHLKYEVMYV